MKKLVTLMLALAMIISAVGVLAEADGKITIWTWDPTFNIKAMQIAKEMYLKDHPDAVIDIQEKLSADIETAVIASNGDTSTLPDILLVQDNSFQKFVTNYPKVYADLTGKYDYEGFAEGKLAYSIVDGKNHGIPFDAGTAVAAYRTDYLEAAGYTAADLTGEGLLISAGIRVPITDDFPKGSLYDLWNTKPAEVAEREMRRAAREAEE
mgnify:CR=1 FL=1